MYIIRIYAYLCCNWKGSAISRYQDFPKKKFVHFLLITLEPLVIIRICLMYHKLQLSKHNSYKFHRIRISFSTWFLRFSKSSPYFPIIFAIKSKNGIMQKYHLDDSETNSNIMLSHIEFNRNFSCYLPSRKMANRIFRNWGG